MILNSISLGLISAFLCKSNKKQKRRTSVVLSLLLPVLVSSVFLAVGAPYLTLYQSQQLYHTPAKVGRTLLWDKRIIDVDDKLYVTGYVFGVFSAGFYVFARVPQIIKNVSHTPLLSLSLSPIYIVAFCIIHPVHALFCGGSLCAHVHSVSPWQCHLWSGHSPLLSGWHLSPTEAALVGGQSGHNGL